MLTYINGVIKFGKLNSNLISNIRFKTVKYTLISSDLHTPPALILHRYSLNKFFIRTKTFPSFTPLITDGLKFIMRS